MFFLLASIVSAAGVTLSLKVATSRGMPVPRLNFFYRAGMGSFAVAGLLSTFAWTEFPALWARTWPYVLPGIGLLYLAGTATMTAVSFGHMGISMAVIRSSMVLPVAFTLVFLWQADEAKFFTLLPWALGGCSAVLLGFVCFGMERGSLDHSESPLAWMLWLGGAFVAQGGWDIVVALASRLPARETLFCFYLTSLGAALASSVKRAAGSGKTNWRLALWGLGAGVLSLLVSLLRPLAVKDLGGLIVFPAFSIGGMLMVQVLGALIWKQHLGKPGWLGVGFSSLGIVFLVFCRH